MRQLWDEGYDAWSAHDIVTEEFHTTVSVNSCRSMHRYSSQVNSQLNLFILFGG